jgi:hypothetical protein
MSISDIEIVHRILLLLPVILRNILRPVQMTLIESSSASKDSNLLAWHIASRDFRTEEVVYSIFFAALMAPCHHHKLLLLLFLLLPTFLALTI